jgi:hypothetical protein
MKNRILIIRGSYNKIRILDCVFTLIKPIDITNGKVTATINASSLLGPDYSKVDVNVEDYKLLD